MKKPKPIEFTIEDFTPEMAKEALATNPHNRPPITKGWKRFSRAMSAGDWKLNGDTICFDEEGNLLNGQHRCLAVVDSGVTIRVFVVRNLPRDVFPTMDSGIVRTPATVLAIMGAKNYKLLAATLPLIDNLITTGRPLSNSACTSPETLRLLELYPEVAQSVSMACDQSIVSPRLLSACHYLFARFDRPQADAFLNGVIKGVQLTPEDPVYLLRERFISNRAKKEKMGFVDLLALTIKAWNYVRAGRKVRFLKHASKGDVREAFPIPE